ITGLADRAETLRSDAFKFLQTYQAHPTPPTSTTSTKTMGTELRSTTVTDYRRMNDRRAYDIIYIAPPQYEELSALALALVDSSTLCVDETVVIVQIHPKERPGVAAVECKHFELTDERRYGSTLLMFYRHRPA